MCRWFAYISPTEPCLLSDVLLTPANSISKQCSEHYLPGLLPHDKDKDLDHSSDALVRMRNSLLNMDGLGLTWYTPTLSAYTSHSRTPTLLPALYKSQSPPINDFNFRSLCENTESRCVFAHIRASSGTTVTQVNSHPFVFGRHVFMHNGAISDFAAIKRDLTALLSFDAYCNIRGATDSEHAAALYMTNLTASGPASSWEESYSLSAMLAAMTKTLVQIMQLQKSKLGAARTPNSLNFCTTDGTQLLAIRFRNHADQQPPSLYWSTSAGRTLNAKYPGHPDGAHLVNTRAVFGAEDEIGRHAIVASEPTTYDEKEWHLIGRNCAFTVDGEGREAVCEIVYDGKELNAEDPTAEGKKGGEGVEETDKGARRYRPWSLFT